MQSLQSVFLAGPQRTKKYTFLLILLAALAFTILKESVECPIPSGRCSFILISVTTHDLPHKAHPILGTTKILVKL